MTLLASAALSVAVACSADLKAGQAAYDRECADCHDATGAPVASVSKSMRKQQVTMRHLGSKEVQAQSDEAWKKMILEGTGKMKPIKTMSSADIDNVIAFMRSWKKK